MYFATFLQVLLTFLANFYVHITIPVAVLNRLPHDDMSVVYVLSGVLSGVLSLHCSCVSCVHVFMSLLLILWI